MSLDDIWVEIGTEYDKATQTFPKFNSAHEGYAVILEEVRELEAEVFENRKFRSLKRMRVEAIQIAAMAIRFIEDIC